MQFLTAIPAFFSSPLGQQIIGGAWNILKRNVLQGVQDTARRTIKDYSSAARPVVERIGKRIREYTGDEWEGEYDDIPQKIRKKKKIKRY